MRQTKKTDFAKWIAAGALVVGLATPQLSFANHNVNVAGNVDFDGDGRVGIAEDMDGTAGDPQGITFGTIAGCLGDQNGGIAGNGTCTIVTSGAFAEAVSITNQVTLEGAPGVFANIEAFLAPADPRLQEFPAAAAAPFALMGSPGIVIDSPANRQVILRNLAVINWMDGIVIRGDSNVIIDNVRLDHNVNSGITIMDNANVTIINSQITSTGLRLNPMTGNFPSAMNTPNPGIGIRVIGNGATVSVRDTLVSGSFGAASEGAGNLGQGAQRNVIVNNNRMRQLQLQ